MPRTGVWPRALLWMSLMVVAASVASVIRPYSDLTWALEIFPVAIALPVLYATARRYPLTPLLYWLIGLHCLVLILGAHYTYARVPIGFWVQDLFDFSRNHYDRFGHFMQGFVPAVLARELLLRCTPLQRGGWLFYLVLAACLSFSAFFEFIEWWVALIMGGDADAYLATQGDIWDTHWDMFLALCGAILAQLMFARLHDRQLGIADRR